MAHWAEIDKVGIVTRVLVTDNNDPNGDEGEKWLADTFGGTWLKTSFNGRIRKNFASIGYTYDKDRDAFIPPKGYPSHVFDEETCTWQAPIPKPTDGKKYLWNEEELGWIDEERAKILDTNTKTKKK